MAGNLLLVKSLARMKPFIAALVLVMFLTGYAITAVVTSVSGYGVMLASQIAEQTRPHIRVMLAAPLQPGGKTPLLEALGIHGGPRLETLVSGVEEAWDRLAGQRTTRIESSPLVECRATYSLLGGAHYGGPLHLIIRLGSVSPEEKIDPEEMLLSKPWIRAEAKRLMPAIMADASMSPNYWAVPVGEPAPWGSPPGGAYRGPESFEPTPIVLLPGRGSESIELYYVRDLYIAIVPPGALECLGITSVPEQYSPSQGDGRLDAMASPVLAALLGVPPDGYRDLPLGGVTLRVWGLGMENPYYASRLGAPIYTLNLSAYEAAYALIIPPEETSDLELLLSQRPDNGTLGLEAYLAAASLFYINASLSPPRERPGEGPIVAPSLIYQYMLGKAPDAPSLASRLVSREGNTSMKWGWAGTALSYVAQIYVADFSPQRLAEQPVESLLRDASDLGSAIRDLLDSVAGLGGVEECNETLFYGSGLAPQTVLENIFQSGDTIVRYPAPGSGMSIPCAAIMVVEDFSISPIIQARSRGVFENPLIAVGIVSIVPALLAIAWIMLSNVTTILVGSARRWIAVAAARGMNPGLASRSLLLLAVVLGPIAVGAGVALGTISAPTGLGARSLAAAGLAGLAVALLSVYRRGREARSVSPAEAVRPALSITRLPLPERGRLNTLAIALYLLSAAVGLARLSEETLQRIDEMGSAAPVIFLLLFLAVMVAPLAPLLGLSELSTIAARLFSARSLARAVSRLYTRALGDLGYVAARGGEKLRDALLSGVRAVGMGLGLVIGASLAFSGVTPELLRSASQATSYSIQFRAGVGMLRGMLLWAGLAGLLFALVMTAAVSLSVAAHLRRQVIVLRARGATRRQALVYVYSSFAPFILASILTGLVAAAGFYLGLDAVLALANLEDMSQVPHLVPSLDPAALSLTLAAVLGVAAVPGLLAVPAVRGRDLARLLREGI